MRMDWQPDGLIRTTSKRLMASANHRCFSLLMAKYWFTSPIPTSHYDTPGTFDKNLVVCHHILDHYLIDKLRQTAQHYGKRVKKYTQRKSNTHKLSNQNAKKSSSIATFNVHIFNQSTAKITRYSMSKKQGMNKWIQNTISENLSKGTSSTS